LCSIRASSQRPIQVIQSNCRGQTAGLRNYDKISVTVVINPISHICDDDPPGLLELIPTIRTCRTSCFAFHCRLSCRSRLCPSPVRLPPETRRNQSSSLTVQHDISPTTKPAQVAETIGNDMVNSWRKPKNIKHSQRKLNQTGCSSET
jgi:hypothetical protein